MFIYRHTFEIGDCVSHARQRMFFSGLAMVVLFFATPAGTLLGERPVQAYMLALFLFFIAAFSQWHLISNRARHWEKFEPVLYTVDLPLLTVGLWVAGPSLFFIMPLLAVVALIRGLRHGPVSLGLHLTFGFVVCLGLLFFHPWWHTHADLVLMNLFLLSVLPFHFYAVSLKIHENSRNLIEETLRDPLTRAFNRKALEGALWSALGSRKPFVLSFLDLDNFKMVNDTHGHGMGDKLLRRICTRLEIRLRAQDRLYRLAGDEFIVLSPAEFTLEGAEGLGQRVRDAIAEVISHTCPDTHVTASVGVLVVKNTEGLNVDDLLRHADGLMYRAKRAGKNRVLVELKQ